MGIYNYTSFPLDADREDFTRFPDIARVGTKAPDGELVDARDGVLVNLNDLYREGVTILEFGSLT